MDSTKNVFKNMVLQTYGVYAVMFLITYP